MTDVEMYVDGIYIGQGTANDYSASPDSDEVECFDRNLTFNSRPKIEVNITKMDYYETNQAALTKVIREMNDNRDGIPIVFKDITEVTEFTGCTNAKYQVKNSPKNKKEIEMSFKADDYNTKPL
jgi:hypothetical protein